MPSRRPVERKHLVRATVVLSSRGGGVRSCPLPNKRGERRCMKLVEQAIYTLGRYGPRCGLSGRGQQSRGVCRGYP